MKFLIFFLMLTANLHSLAAQLHEVDANNCPETLKIYTGDTVRFTNHSAFQTNVKSAMFNYEQLSQGDYFDYKFTPSPDNPYVMPDAYINYTCFHEGIGVVQRRLRVGAPPIVIYPKYLVHFGSEDLKLGVWIPASESFMEGDTAIKKIFISFNNHTIFAGTLAEYHAFLKTQSPVPSESSYININCSYNINAYAACSNTEKGYFATYFRIPAARNTLDTVYGNQTLRVKLTLSTPQGDVDYEDKAVYLVRLQ